MPWRAWVGRWLCWVCCCCRAPGAATAAATQARSAPIHVLDLGNNSMSGEGAAALARLLHGKKSAKELHLYMNQIGDGGMESLASAIGACK